MKQTIPIYSVVAWSGTGKTTLLEKLIPELKQRGIRIALMKHDAHEFEIDKVGKDSWRMTRAGADMTIVASSTKAAIMENRHVDAEELLAHVHDVDLILTEGYKHGIWPKIMVYREAVGKGLPLLPDECLAVVTDDAVETERPIFSLEDAEGLADFIIKHMDNNG